MSTIGKVVDKMGEPCQLVDIGNDGPIHFELEVRDHCRQVAVPRFVRRIH